MDPVETKELIELVTMVLLLVAPIFIGVYGLMYLRHLSKRGPGSMRDHW